LYYVMPLVRGESLRDRLTRERQLPVGEAIHIATVIAGALDYAHRQGVLHRDIKPENILLHDGQPVLGDFGIALAVATAGGDRLTHSGLVIGTPSYMSPEQVSGDASIDGRSDIYALGCVAYEMLAGEPPFAGPTARAVMAAVITVVVRFRLRLPMGPMAKRRAARRRVALRASAAQDAASASLIRSGQSAGALTLSAWHGQVPPKRTGPGDGMLFGRDRWAWS